MQQHTTLWQLDGWAKAVAHTGCVYYDCCTGQHKVENKGARHVMYQVCTSIKILPPKNGVTLKLPSEVA